jgi:hypothetical protein
VFCVEAAPIEGAYRNRALETSAAPSVTCASTIAGLFTRSTGSDSVSMRGYIDIEIL